MTSPFGSLVVIADPSAGGGSVAEELPALERELKARDLEYDLMLARSPQEATDLARATWWRRGTTARSRTS